MRGLGQIKHENDMEAAKFQQERYEKMRDRAIKKENWALAKRWDGRVEDYRRFLAGEITVYPGGDQAKAGEFTPAEGRDFGPQPA